MSTAQSTETGYRDLISDFADMAPASGFKAVGELPGLCPEDLLLVAHTNLDVLQQILLTAIRAECDRRNESRHERQLEDFYGSSHPQSERERLMMDLGLREGDFR